MESPELPEETRPLEQWLLVEVLPAVAQDWELAPVPAAVRHPGNIAVRQEALVLMRHLRVRLLWFKTVPAALVVAAAEVQSRLLVPLTFRALADRCG